MNLLDDFNRTFAIRRYNFMSPSTEQSMNPIGLVKNDYNKSMFRRPADQMTVDNNVLNEPKDQFLNYANNDSNQVFSGTFEGISSDATISDRPIRLKHAEDGDLHLKVRQDVVDMWRLLFDPNKNIFTTSYTREQKFESAEPANGQVAGQNASTIFSLSVYRNGDNKREYDFESPRDEFVSYLKSQSQKNIDKLKNGTTQSSMKTSSQKKMVDHGSIDVPVASVVARTSIPQLRT